MVAHCGTWLVNYNMKRDDIHCISTNYPLDSKNAVCLADFNESIKWAGEPQEIRSDLQVISTIVFLFHLSASLFVSFIPLFPLAN